MPHDKNGCELKVGDKVTIEAEVTQISPNPDYCNMTVATVEPMHPGKHMTTITLNCKQVVKCCMVLLALLAFGGVAQAQTRYRVVNNCPPTFTVVNRCAPAAACICGDNCKCGPGVCPACPTATAPVTFATVGGSCANGQCGVPVQSFGGYSSFGGSCANGQCGTAPVSRGFFRRR